MRNQGPLEPFDLQNMVAPGWLEKERPGLMKEADVGFMS